MKTKIKRTKFARPQRLKKLSQAQKEDIWFYKGGEDEAFDLLEKKFSQAEIERLLKKMPSYKYSGNRLSAITELAWENYFGELK